MTQLVPWVVVIVGLLENSLVFCLGQFSLLQCDHLGPINQLYPVQFLAARVLQVFLGAVLSVKLDHLKSSELVQILYPRVYGVDKLYDEVV